MTSADSPRSSNDSSYVEKPQEERQQTKHVPSKKERLWLGEGWGGVGTSKWDDRKAWGIGSGKYGMYKREDFGFKPKESKE